MGNAITGWGTALPDKVVTNADLEARLDTSDTWIVERTGIRERRIGGTTSELATEACERALLRAGLTGADVDLLVLATTTPDQTVPATSASVHHALGCRGGAFDLNAACAGFVYALVTVDALLRANGGRALVVGTDTLSRITDHEDRSTAILFGDGSGALVVDATAGGAGPLVLGSDLGVDGSAAGLLFCDHGGTMQMEGREVFRRAVRAELDSIAKVLEASGVEPADLALFVPHQANLRIIEAINQRIGFDLDRTALVLDRTGNTSAASIPLALCEAADAGRLRDGDLVLLSGFGAGMTWSSAVIRWGTAAAGR